MSTSRPAAAPTGVSSSAHHNLCAGRALNEPPSPWRETEVRFELEPDESGTWLTFVHADWQELGDSFAVCSFDWGAYMRSIKRLVETGAGAPEPVADARERLLGPVN